MIGITENELRSAPLPRGGFEMQTVHIGKVATSEIALGAIAALDSNRPWRAGGPYELLNWHARMTNEERLYPCVVGLGFTFPYRSHERVAVLHPKEGEIDSTFLSVLWAAGVRFLAVRDRR